MLGFKAHKKVHINGKEYESIQKAALALGLHHITVGKWFKQLANSGRSEIDFTIKVPKTFTMKKLKENN